jgi:hypothetical protein
MIKGQIFFLQVTQGVVRALESNVYIQFGDPNPPQWKGPIKWNLAEFCQKASGKWTQLPPMALLS